MKVGKQVAGISEVAVAEIEVTQRIRDVSEAGVASLIASVERLGVMKDPIQVRRLKGGKLRLMAGGHRLEAARRMGWAMIPAAVWDCNDAWAQFMEIDDNLAGSGLTPLDTAVFLARRKRLYEEQFPQAAQGGDRGNQHTGGRQTDIMSFCQATAEKIAKSERHVRRMVAAGERLDPRDVQLLRAAPRPVGLQDLQVIAKIGNPVERYDVVEALAGGRAKSAKQALDQLQEKAPPKSTVEAAFEGLLKAWDRAPMAARRRFVESREADLRRVLPDGGADD